MRGVPAVRFGQRGPHGPPNDSCPAHRAAHERLRRRSAARRPEPSRPGRRGLAGRRTTAVAAARVARAAGGRAQGDACRHRAGGRGRGRGRGCACGRGGARAVSGDRQGETEGVGPRRLLPAHGRPGTPSPAAEEADEAREARAHRVADRVACPVQAGRGVGCRSLRRRRPLPEDVRPLTYRRDVFSPRARARREHARGERRRRRRRWQSAAEVARRRADRPR